MHVVPDGVGDVFMGAGGDRPCGGRVLYVGRIMRHKGIDVLIDALGERTGLVAWARMTGVHEHPVLAELLYASPERAGAGSLA